MRKGDGSDVLGPGNPQSSDIGMIYVGPADSRPDVLKAINTEEITGRKQIAIVLEEQHKAFRQPVDFDGLKNVRRGLKAQLVFIASPGPGPANFARQRNFLVYSSLENFRQALITEGIPSPNRRAKAKPGPLDFLSRRPKATPAANQEPSQAAPPLVVPPPRPQRPSGRPSPIVPPSDLSERETVETSSPDKKGAEARGATDFVVDSWIVRDLDSDDEALAPFPPLQTNPPLPTPTAQGSSTSGFAGEHISPPSSQPREENPPDESIVILPVPDKPKTTSKGGSITKNLDTQTRRSGTLPTPQNPPNALIFGSGTSSTTQNPSGTPSGKLPPLGNPPVVPISGSSTSSLTQNPPATQTPPAGPTRRGNTGKIPAVAGVGASTSPTSGTATQTSPRPVRPTSRGVPGSSTRTPSGLTPLPPVRSRAQRRRKLRNKLLLLALLILSVVLALSILLASAHNLFPSALTAQVTITPASKFEQNNYLIQGLMSGTPDPTKNEVSARTLTATSPTKTVSGIGMGKHQVPATGPLTFRNNNAFRRTTTCSTLKSNSGIVVSFPGPLTLDGGATLTVTGTAENFGPSGDIPYGDINAVSCGDQILVTNYVAFSGGIDERNIIQQSDIDTADSPVVPELKTNAMNALKGMRKSNEHGTKNPDCTTNASSDPAKGVNAAQFTVHVSVTCTETVYDYQGAQQIAHNNLQQTAKNDLSQEYQQYTLDGQIVVGVLSASEADGQVRIETQAAGMWVYQFTDKAKQDLQNMLAKGSKKENALFFLQHYPGVGKAQITLSSGDVLPTNAKDIILNIQTLPGAQATFTPHASQSTPGNGNPTPTSAPNSSTPMPDLGGS
jgi:hypothetical protein